MSDPVSETSPTATAPARPASPIAAAAQISHAPRRQGPCASATHPSGVSAPSAAIQAPMCAINGSRCSDVPPSRESR
ncbi:MAG TPA: hypothetical protein VGL58_19290 [Caulobacteraceae bacterium]